MDQPHSRRDPGRVGRGLIPHCLDQAASDPSRPAWPYRETVFRAAGEEVRRDKQRERRYKANHALTKRFNDGTQKTFWIDIDEEVPRHRMVKALANYRDQMVGEAVIGTNTADHWNRINPEQEPLAFEADFTDDVQSRLNAPEDDQRAS